jgi:hypothetical protein
MAKQPLTMNRDAETLYLPLAFHTPCVFCTLSVARYTAHGVNISVREEGELLHDLPTITELKPTITATTQI